MDYSLANLTARQWRDYCAREPGTCFADPGFVLDLREAYELQDAVSALRIAAGDRVAGYKVGCTGPGTVAQFGMEGPIRGYLYESELHKTGEILAASAFAGLAIEGEMALRMGEDGQIAAAFPVIELHHFVFRAPRKTFSELVANNGFNAGVVLPDDEWPSSRCMGSEMTLSVSINGRLVGSGGLWPMAGGPDASIRWLRQHLADFEQSLLPGQLPLAGTSLGLYPVGPGDHVSVSVDEGPIIKCTVV